MKQTETLEALRRIRDELRQSSDPRGLQIETVLTVRASSCRCLAKLAQFAKSDKGDTWAWRAMIESGLEPLCPQLPKIAALLHLPMIPSTNGPPIARQEADVDWTTYSVRILDLLIELVERELAPSDEAFGAAREFVNQLDVLAYHARRYQARPEHPDAWQEMAFVFGAAFIAWFDLTHLLTPAVLSEARRVYSPGAPAIKMGEAAFPTVIEAVAGVLGLYFRNTVYAGRSHPLEPNTRELMEEAKDRATAQQVALGRCPQPMGYGAQLSALMKEQTREAIRLRRGIKTQGEAVSLMMREWMSQDRQSGEAALFKLRCETINFGELQTSLIREAEAVMASTNKAIAQIDRTLVARLEAVAATIPAALEESRTEIERVARAVESLGARNDAPMTPKKPKPTRRERKVKWLAEVMLTVRDHPEWSDAAIAERAGIDKSRLSRSPEYQAAARMARTPKTPDGSVTIADGDRSVEAVDDSFDPNRPASRQWHDEEDRDDRINREMNERNAKRNGRR